ncbi:single-stranded DNA-binding protein [Xenophilus azovorans]|uniref:single-stranded DNA-binding protein n=1 Tax=Xenophilus azovorans TaxID=151755 RepID=UPI00068D6FE7|nr:single-stranded DNA-binding protein [Xenophilus azovorans]
MFSKNYVELIGNLGRDPEIKSFPDGGRVANARLATTARWKDRESGERREHTEWHNLVFRGDGLVRIVEDYVRKGAFVLVEGHLRTRRWQDKDGQDRYVTEVYVDKIGLLDKAESEAGPGGGASERDDDMPF